MPLSMTKAKKTSGDAETVVERVSKARRTVRIDVCKKMRRDGEIYLNV